MKLVARKLIFMSFLTVSVMTVFSQNLNFEKDNRIYKIDSLTVTENSFFEVLDKLIEFEKESKYYSNLVSYCIEFYRDSINAQNIIKIEGSDNEWLFIESVNLAGYFKYKNHEFYLLTEFKELFSKTNSLKTKCEKERKEILIDDRWAIYYFGFDSINYYYFKRVNFTEK
jgi:hypothetical protein